VTKHTYVRAALVVAIAVLMGSACTSTATAPSSSTVAPGGGGSVPGGTASPGSSAMPASNAPHRVGHVWVIVLENENADDTFGEDSPATYLNGTLLPQGTHLTQYYATGHLSLDNYISMVSGQAPNPKTQADCTTYTEFVMTGTADLDQAIGEGCVYPKEVLTVADQLSSAGYTWKGYMEDMGNDPKASKTCRHPEIGAKDETVGARDGDQYATRHNPFVYFHSIIDSPVCDERDVPLEALEQDLASVDSSANFNFITPNLCHDGHDEPCVNKEPGGLVSADAFLKEWVGKIQASPAYKLDGAIFITFDESEGFGPEGDSTSCCDELPGPNTERPGLSGPGGGRVGAVVLSPFVTPNTTNDTPYNHYSFLCSIEQLFDLDKLGMAAQPGLPCFGTGDEVFDKKEKS
jgi:hypothetical protein